MKVLPVNRTSTLTVIILICFRFLLAVLQYIPSIEFSESMGKIPMVYNLLSIVYIYLYLRNFLGEVMKEKGFSIPLLLLPLLTIISELLNSVPFSSGLFYTVTVINFLIVVVDIWIWVKIIMLPQSAFRKYLRWYTYLSILGIVASLSVKRLFEEGVINFTTAALSITFFLSFINQLPFASILLMVLAYQKSQKNKW